MTVATAEFQKVMADLNKKMGPGSVVQSSQVINYPRMRTGSVTYDYILGGGWTGNQWHEIIGENSHGKTGVVLKALAHNQAINPDFTAVWVAAEDWIPSYARMCDVDSSRVYVVSTRFMEDAYEAVINIAETKGIDCIVIDSLAAMSPSTEMAKTMEENTVGRGALLTNKFFRKVGPAMRRSLIEEERPIVGIMINQFRMKIGGYGDPRTTPGGVGKDYAYVTRTEVKRDEWIEVGPASDKTRVGQTIRLRTIKNKTAPPQRSALVDFYWDEGGLLPPGSYDTGKEIASMALVLGIVERRGGWVYYGEDKWNGLAAFVEELRGNLTLADDITAQVMEKAL